MRTYDITSLLERIVAAEKWAGDLLFSPDHEPRTIRNGQMANTAFKEFQRMNAYQVEMLALNLLKDKPRALERFIENGSVDISFDVSQVGRFRAHIFKQRNLPVVILRIIPATIPTFDSLGLTKAANALIEKPGLSIVAGLAGSGKSTTIAAAISQLSQQRAQHIITIEDPIEYIFPAHRGMVHQREVGTDTRDVASALRDALRQAPQAIMVSKLTGREAIEAALEAAESGCLVLAGVPAADPDSALRAIMRHYSAEGESQIRSRLAQSLQALLGIRLIPRKDGKGRIPVTTLLRNSRATRQYLLDGKNTPGEMERLLKENSNEGMYTFAMDLARLASTGLIAQQEDARTPTTKIEAPSAPVRRGGGASLELELPESQSLEELPTLGLDQS